MGCTSSTQMEMDPVSGEYKPKHKMGGSYPGNRRTPQQPHTPSASEFNSQGQATAHFVNYGGGNALVLQQNGIAQPVGGAPETKTPTFIQVTLPAGVNGGDKIHVQAPDGRLNEIIVPDGFGPGSTFTVEFAEGSAPSTPAPESSYTAPVAPATYAAPEGDNTNDGFVSGFNNPSVPMASPTTSYGQADLSSYPAASDAKPVYSSTPTYSATTY